MSTLLYNAGIVAGGTTFHGWLLIGDNGDITATGSGSPGRDITECASQAVDCEGDLLMPGAIDTHVHFRDPGLTSKGDIATESRAAVAGGVTSYIDMPNTRPATVDIASWQAKMDRAAAVSMANYAFFLGATNDNMDTLLAADYSRIPGVKLFMGSSTGNMLVDSDTTLDRLFAAVPAVIAVHAEDEATIRANRERLLADAAGRELPLTLHSQLRSRRACVEATRRAIDLAERHGSRLHLLHVSTADELSLIASARRRGVKVTAETCPHYLIFTDADMQRLGARVKCNPAIKSETDRLALLDAVRSGLIDVIATDHAPHLPSDKEGDLLRAASGMPGVQFSLPLMLDLLDGDAAAVARLMAEAPAILYGIAGRGRIAPGCRADLVRVSRLDRPRVISDTDVVSLCGWTPYAGIATRHRVVTTWVNGTPAFDRGRFASAPAAEPLTF